MTAFQRTLGVLIVLSSGLHLARAQDDPPRRGGEPPAVRGERQPGARGEDRPRGQEPGVRRPPGSPGFPPPELEPRGFEGPPGPRGRAGFRGPPDGPRGMGGVLVGDPEMAQLIRQDDELEQRTQELVRHIEQLAGQVKTGNEIDRAKAELKEVVTQHFDVRQKRRELQVKRLEDELKRLQEAVARRNEARDEIIKKRLADLSGQTNDLEF